MSKLDKTPSPQKRRLAAIGGWLLACMLVFPATIATAATPPDQPPADAEQVLRRLLELVRTSQSIADFTSRHVQAVMGTPLGPGKEMDSGFRDELTPQWKYSFSVSTKQWEYDLFDVIPKEKKTRFTFSLDRVPGPPPHLSGSAICQFDFGQFAAALTAMGYASQRSVRKFDPMNVPLPGAPVASYDQWTYTTLFRKEPPALTIQIYSRGESSEKPDHTCIQSILIQDDTSNRKHAHDRI